MQHYLRNVEPLNASLLERRLLQCELISRLCCTTIFHLRLSVASRLKDVSSHVQRGQTTIGEENIKKKLNAEKLGHDRSKLWRGTHRKQYPVTNSDTPTKTNASKKRSGVSQENLHSPAQHNTAPHSTHFIGVIAQTPRRGEASAVVARNASASHRIGLGAIVPGTSGGTTLAVYQFPSQPLHVVTQTRQRRSFFHSQPTCRHSKALEATRRPPHIRGGTAFKRRLISLRGRRDASAGVVIECRRQPSTETNFLVLRRSTD